MTKPRLIAFYLPQYHPIPENDEWWGKGFTEWTNVAKAKPLFKGHYQPHLPADLGFYDLRVPEVREQQAELAREAGIEGFCYWHYWFAGKQLLERPFNEVLASGKPDFPFCIGWANQSWTGIWHGSPDRILMEQTYPGFEDHQAHFQTLLPAFKDSRYIKVDGKPLFVIFRPQQLPQPKETIHLWNGFAKSAGLKGLFFVGVTDSENMALRFTEAGFDGLTVLSWRGSAERNLLIRALSKLLGKQKMIGLYQMVLKKPYHMYDFLDGCKTAIIDHPTRFNYFPGITPNWDNTPRSGLNGSVVLNSNPAQFKLLVQKAIDRIKDYEDEHKLIFIKSWNEWAEGNYLEPDTKFGHGYLEAVKEALEANNGDNNGTLNDQMTENEKNHRNYHLRKKE